MGKIDQRLPLQQQQTNGSRTNSEIFCERCSMGLSRMCRGLSFKCVFVLILSVSVFLSAIFWVLPLRSRKFGFEAKDEIKSSATVQAYFRVQKPISLLIPHIARLEYDIYVEIGVPYTKVAILSMQQEDTSDWTDVVFGILSEPMNVPINLVSLSVLRSSLIELFLQQINLTLTTTTFGKPSSFEVLKFPGGITLIPLSYSLWQIPEILFNFTLNNSIVDIKENFVELREQLKLGLHLKPYENVYVQVTNEIGSTKDPPVTVQVSVMSDLGSILRQRLEQLVQTIQGSPEKNLGLDHSVFGKVKQISLSSNLDRILHATSPTPSPSPSPAPSPELNVYAESPDTPSPAISVPYLPAPSPNFHHLSPCSNCDASSPSISSFPYPPSPGNELHHSFPPMSNSPSPSMVGTRSPPPSPHCVSKISPSPLEPSQMNPPSAAFAPHLSTPSPPPVAPTPRISPGFSPLPAVSYGSNPGQDEGNGKGSVSPPIVSPSSLPLSPSHLAVPSFKTWLCCFFLLLTFHHLC